MTRYRGPVSFYIYVVYLSYLYLHFLYSDLVSERLVVAKELGADFQLEVGREDKPQQLAEKVAAKLGSQPHITIECTGVESCIQTAIYVREYPE